MAAFALSILILIVTVSRYKGKSQATAQRDSVYSSLLCKQEGFISVEHAEYLAIEDRICQPRIAINSSSKRLYAVLDPRPGFNTRGSSASRSFDRSPTKYRRNFDLRLERNPRK